MNNIPECHKVVLVTGFGLFSNTTKGDTNASGEAVKLIDKNELESKLNITLIARRVPIEYKYVDKVVPKMWQQYRPNLTIHVGVSDEAKGFTLETQARKVSYTLKDHTHRTPKSDVNPSSGPENITTNLQVELIRDEFNYDLPEDSLKCDVSFEAGNYLSEYIYYTSLSQQLNEYRSSLLVHVPPVKYQKEFEELARGLERILEFCVAQLRIQDNCEEHVRSLPPLAE